MEERGICYSGKDFLLRPAYGTGSKVFKGNIKSSGGMVDIQIIREKNHGLCEKRKIKNDGGIVGYQNIDAGQKPGERIARGIDISPVFRICVPMAVMSAKGKAMRRAEAVFECAGIKPYRQRCPAVFAYELEIFIPEGRGVQNKFFPPRLREFAVKGLPERKGILLR